MNTTWLFTGTFVEFDHICHTVNAQLIGNESKGSRDQNIAAKLTKGGVVRTLMKHSAFKRADTFHPLLLNMN